MRADKQREVRQGYDGTWVAHPDLVPIAREVFDAGPRGRAQSARAPARRRRRRPPRELLDLAATPGEVTEAGLRTDVNVGFQYVSFWLSGRGAAAINSLMEDAATAEISRSQLWQWVHHGVHARTTAGRSPPSSCAGCSTRRRRDPRAVGEETWEAGRPDETRAIFERVALSPELIEFLTLAAYDTSSRR